MSKMDGLRAMREARYARATSGKANGSPGTRLASAPAAPVARKPVAAPAAPEEAAGEQLCGHRNMGGRTCTREAGHAAKSHRYS